MMIERRLVVGWFVLSKVKNINSTESMRMKNTNFFKYRFKFKVKRTY